MQNFQPLEKHAAQFSNHWKSRCSSLRRFLHDLDFRRRQAVEPVHPLVNLALPAASVRTCVRALRRENFFHQRLDFFLLLRRRDGKASAQASEKAVELANEKAAELAADYVIELVDNDAANMASQKAVEIAEKNAAGWAEQKAIEIADEFAADWAEEKAAEIADENAAAWAEQNVAAILVEITIGHTADIPTERIGELAAQKAAETAAEKAVEWASAVAAEKAVE